MKIWNSLDDVPAETGQTVVSLGCFDGVHRGHRLLLARLLNAAETNAAKSVVVTFDPLPAQLLYPETAPLAVMALEDRLAALEVEGVDAVLVIRYTRDVAAQAAEVFVEKVFVKTLHAAAVVVGEDCRFGQGRAGNIETLRAAGLRWSFDVSVLGDRTAGGTEGRRYSSTWVREALSSGDVGIAEQILGRPHRIRMEVTRAAGSWRTKARSVQGMLPASGDYAGWARVGSDERIPAIIRIPGRASLATDITVELQMPADRYAEKSPGMLRKISFDFSSTS